MKTKRENKICLRTWFENIGNDEIEKHRDDLETALTEEDKIFMKGHHPTALTIRESLADKKSSVHYLFIELLDKGYTLDDDIEGVINNRGSIGIPVKQQSLQ